MSVVQWYPGHMAKAIREMKEISRAIDLVLILLDARAPFSSLNPLFDEAFQNKRILYVLTKIDKADVRQTSKWIDQFKTEGKNIIGIDARSNIDSKKLVRACEQMMESKREKDKLKGLKPRPIKTMIVGIPNVGKSTLINALVKKKVAVVGDKPGVTKKQQWIRINQALELLDTPGVLWPKFEDQQVGIHLALIGSIKDSTTSLVDLAIYAISFLKEYYPHALKRYEVDLALDSEHYLNEFAKHLFVGEKEDDIDIAAVRLINDLRDERLGRITFDRWEDEPISA